jgi:hypothetical protein
MILRGIWPVGIFLRCIGKVEIILQNSIRFIFPNIDIQLWLLLVLAPEHDIFVQFELFELHEFFIDRVIEICSFIYRRLVFAVVSGAHR